MSIFDKLRSAPTGWENMAPAENVSSMPPTEDLEKIRASEKRQREKLIGALLPGEGNPDVSKIVSEPNLGEHDESIVLAKISQGLIGYEDFAKVIDNIKGPMTDSYGEFSERAALAPLDRMMEDKHQLKMLAFANDFNPDEHYQKTGLDDLAQAVETFKNPMQFEAKMRPFMTFLAEHNSPQKVAEYKSAFVALEQNLFGKKYEYYQRSKELVAESQEIFGMPIKSPLELPDVPVAERKSEPAKNVEREQTHESLIKSGSEYQISRTQARNGVRANLGEMVPYDDSCEDSKFIDLEHGLLGVFDGVGGHFGGKLASSTAADAMADLLRQNGEPKSPADLSDWLDEASKRVANNPGAGNSTATIAKIAKRPDGGKAVMYAQVGDSRLYIVHPDGRTELVTKDEGEGKYITNALGMKDRDRVCMQAGYRELNDGDKLVLCSDGITGDKDAELMSNEELGGVVSSNNVAYAAQALVNSARKNDDRTAIVVEV